ncbi:GNAT family acetyltransferase [Luteimicrobium xylanilyticum]|uniref:Amino-acid N-acetyltransferase n=1 Tax=Luteimicrobium xylanilyticum TaxID=1133546 RepID=A0A5P9Q8K4_9MICO|nr:GNAT family acetyltransferase [Luteimicrobium xylanilyticum]QFU97382.1 Amino-acid N-acetyltransferase [Luteimicrobium xylanilyticum]
MTPTPAGSGPSGTRDGVGLRLPAPVLRLAEATDDDVAPLVALWTACGLTRPWNDPERDLEDARATATSTVLVGRVGPVAAAGAGTVVSSAVAGYDGHRGWLYYVAVDPAWQGRGFGRETVVAAEAWLAAQGAPKVQLMVRHTNTAAVGFYEALGYTDQEATVLGRRFPAAQGGPEVG